MLFPTWNQVLQEAIILHSSPSICFTGRDPLQWLPLSVAAEVQQWEAHFLHAKSHSPKSASASKIINPMRAVSILKCCPDPNHAHIISDLLVLFSSQYLPAHLTSKPQRWTQRTYLPSFEVISGPTFYSTSPYPTCILSFVARVVHSALGIE